MTKKGTGKTSKTCEGCSRWEDIRQKVRVSTLVRKAIKAFERKLESDELKLTTAEYLKLLQMEQEMEQDNPKEIRVTWVEPPAKSES